MKITFLGTAAAEGIPAVFCNCDNCRRAKALGGKNIRTRNQILIDNDILIDFPMDTYMHMLYNNLDLSAVKAVLVSHAHLDHFSPEDFCMHSAPYAYNMVEPIINIYCNPTVYDLYMQKTKGNLRPEGEQSVLLNVIHAGDTIKLNNAVCYAFPAIHTIGEECLLYLIQRGGKSALILNDTGILPEAFYVAVKKRVDKLDFVSFDCTYGNALHGSGRHMGLLDIVNQIKIMNNYNLIDSNTKLYATHFSHNTQFDFETIAAQVKAQGLTASYDGLTVSV